MEEGTATGGDLVCSGNQPRADSVHPLVRLVVDLPAENDRLACERGVPAPLLTRHELRTSPSRSPLFPTAFAWSPEP